MPNRDSFQLGHFDGSFVYLLTGRLDGDTLRGIFHAGLRTRTPFTAVRSTGARHLRSPTEMTAADTTEPFRFAFPGLDGRTVSNTDPRFRGKVGAARRVRHVVPHLSRSRADAG